MRGCEGSKGVVNGCEGCEAAALTDPVGGGVQLGRGAGHAAAGVRGRVAAGPLAVLQGRRRGRAVLDPLLQTEAKQGWDLSSTGFTEVQVKTVVLA